LELPAPAVALGVSLVLPLSQAASARPPIKNETGTAQRDAALERNFIPWSLMHSAMVNDVTNQNVAEPHNFKHAAIAQGQAAA
jgi:hypothetical protein